jgi:hypothetical protein
MEVRHIETFAEQQTRERKQVARRPLGMGKGRYFDTLFLQRAGKDSTSVQRRDDDGKVTPVAEAHQIEQCGLRSA